VPPLDLPDPAFDPFGLGSYEGLKLHRLPQGIYRGVRDLRGVERNVVEVIPPAPVAPHTREEHAAGISLAGNVVYHEPAPVVILLQIGGIPLNGYRARRAEELAEMAAYTLGAIGMYQVPISIVAMDIKGAYPTAHLTADACLVVPFYRKLRYPFWFRHFLISQMWVLLP